MNTGRMPRASRASSAAASRSAASGSPRVHSDGAAKQPLPTSNALSKQTVTASLEALRSSAFSTPLR